MAHSLLYQSVALGEQVGNTQAECSTSQRKLTGSGANDQCSWYSLHPCLYACLNKLLQMRILDNVKTFQLIRLSNMFDGFVYD